MKVQEFCQSPEKMLVAEPDADNRMRLVSSALQKAFKLRDDEVAVLRVDKQSQVLSFIWPKKRIKSGSVPLSTRDALSVRCRR